jgi:glycosyltransferase involved in cell wall biosynthesis
MVNRKILIAANTDYRFDQRLQRIYGSLSEAGYSVELLGRQFDNTPQIHAAAIHLPLWFRKGKLSYLELNVRFLFYMLQRKTDAICSVDLDTLPACWLASKLNRSILIQDSHEYMAEVPEVAFRPLTKKIWNWVAWALLPGCRLRYTVSQSLVDEFAAVYGQHFELIRNMAVLRSEGQLEADIPGLPENDYLVFLGAVNRGRGLEEILEVLAERDESLLIIGSGDLMEEIKNRVNQYKLGNRVFFTGKILPEQASFLLKKARCGVNLLRDEGLSYRYSLANKFFDYVHAGIPQICIDFSEYRKLMQEHEVGLLSGIAKKDIHAALDQMKIPAVQARFSAATLQAREVWNWQEESRHLLALYKELFDGIHHTESVPQ